MGKKKKMPERMKAIVKLAEPAKVIADVGCDHAYISMGLIKKGKAEKIIASDLRKGPLKIAEENIREAGLNEKIELRLCSGLSGYEKGEADEILITGMGGILIKDILSDGKEIAERAGFLILEPQSDLRLVRAYLRETGFAVIDEDMVFESGKYYQIIKAAKGGRNINFEAEDEFGPVLIEKKHPVLKEFLLKRKKHFEELLQDRQFAKSQNAAFNGRIDIIKGELGLVHEALERF